MERSKVKNMLILLLLIINGFLLVLVGARLGEERRYERSALSQAIQVLGQNNITVSEQVVDDVSGLSPRSVERSADSEAALAQALLGEPVAGVNRGGGLYLYDGSRGEVAFRPGGELSAVLEDDGRWQTDNPANHAARLLRDMGIEAEHLSARQDGDSTTVMFRQRWEGAPVFSCRLSFEYSGGRLRTVTGTVVTGQAGTEQGSALSRPTALLRFLDHILESRDVCSYIESMEAGYCATQDFAGAVRLTPVWRISSNTTDYYMDAATGDLTLIRAP